MTIPENQLEIWAKPGSQTKYKDAHESIRKALEQYDWPNKKPNYEIYLQGSYKNSTTTRSNSDVDVVVQLNSSFIYHSTNLEKHQKDALESYYKYPTYHWDNFRFDVFNALKKNNNLPINQGNKCINVKTPYLDADVVVCMQYRLYEKYLSPQDQKYIEGITFKSHDKWIFNYPKQHDENGTLKSKNTNGNYYSAVRIFKNIKSQLIDKNIINKEEVPSYFIECLLYNVPDSNFDSTHEKTISNILLYLNQQEIKNFVCQNGITSLFGDSPDQWSITNAKKLISGTINIWNKWGK